MANLYDQVQSLTEQLAELHEHITKLNAQCLKADREPFQLVDYLYTMAEYVDNEFYKTLRNVKAKPHQISVLHLHQYNNMEYTVKSKWESIQAWHEDNHGKCPINSFAYSIVSGVLRALELESTAKTWEADKAYNATRGLIEQFIGEMLGSRSFLKASV